MCSGTSEFKRQDNLCMKWVLWESLFREWMSCISTTPFVNLDYLNTVTVFHFSCYLVPESAEHNQWISLKYTGVSRTRSVLNQFKAFVRCADIIKNVKIWPKKLLLLRHCCFWTNWTLFWHRSFYTLLIPCKLVHDSEKSKQWISMNIVVVDTSSTNRLNIVSMWSCGIQFFNNKEFRKMNKKSVNTSTLMD